MLKASHYFNNTEGLNITDSPFFVKEGQATGGYNYDYTRTGGIQKVRGPALLNASADTQLKTLGLGLHETTAGVKTVVRAAGTKIQSFDADSGVATNLTEDTATAGTDFLTSGSTQPVVNSFFTTPTNSLLWLAGGGMTYPVAYNGTKITSNGVAAPTGSFTVTNLGSGTGGTWTTGTYYYALVLRKTLTQALSNAALDQSVAIATATDTVRLTFPTGVDATKYDKWYVYRSSVGGVTSFTAGTLVAQVTVGTATYDDVGNVSVATSQTVPRLGSTVLDNAPLPSGTYNYLCTYKQHLVTASGSTVYISDLIKPESWPAGLQITIPSAGPITGVATLGFNSPQTFPDEFLVVFKAREVWLITGSLVYDSDTALYDVALKFADSVGCISQSLAVSANGFLCWVDYRGIYMWNGLGKPVYCSRLIESAFGSDGNLDKTTLSQGWGVYSRKTNQIMWCLSDRTLGPNKLIVKMDLRLSAPMITDNPVMGNTVIEAVFSFDDFREAFYAGLSYLPSLTSDELLLFGDDSGYLYKAYFGVTDAGADYEFSYQTKALDQGSPTVAKQYNKVVVYVDQTAPKDLTLQYWSGFRILAAERSEIALSLDTGDRINASLWDQATWDESLWDEGGIKPVPLVFNLASGEGNNEGDSLMLKFVQGDASCPLTIHGFTVYYNEISLRK